MNLSTIVKSGQLKIFEKSTIKGAFDPSKINDCQPDFFSSEFWQRKDAIIGSAQGRGTTWFVKFIADDVAKVPQHWVLRHYYRGGLIGRLINDSYFYAGFDKTRAAKEFALLFELQQLGLAAPAPVAFMIKRQGLTYQANILTSLIDGSTDIVTLLTNQHLPDATWEKIGGVIAQFHRHGIYHHDLNSHNILLDDAQKVWLIDFDQGEKRTLTNLERKRLNAPWQQANLTRLKRSFIKEKNINPALHFTEDNWVKLLVGYKRG